MYYEINKYYTLNEAGRHIYDPRTGSINFPDKRFNPPEVCSPREGYRTGGYYEKETSLLLKVYHKDKLKELAEVSIPAFNILQCSGYRNSRDESHDKVLGIIEKWKNKIKEEN